MRLELLSLLFKHEFDMPEQDEEVKEALLKAEALDLVKNFDSLANLIADAAHTHNLVEIWNHQNESKELNLRCILEILLH